MLTEYCIINNKLVENNEGYPKVMVYTNPNEEEKRKAYLPKSIKRHLNWLGSLSKETALS